MSLEQELRATFRQAADELGPAHPVADVRAEGMRALAHNRSRRRVAVLSAGLAVLVIGVGIPAGLSLVEPADNGIAAPSSPEPIPSADIYGGPTRGSLAGDIEFVEAARQLSWTVPGYGSAIAPPVDARRVVFAGDGTGGRWALVVGEITGPAEPTGAPEGVTATPDSLPPNSPPSVRHLTGAWFAGEAGATPAQMRLVKDFPISSDLPASLYDMTTGAIVVVAAPGDRIEVSPRPEVAADGTVSRNYVDAGSSDGVAVTVTQPAPFSSSLTTVQYRVSRPGVVLGDLDPSAVVDSTLDGSQPSGRPLIDVDYLRPPSVAFDREERAYIQDQATIILMEYGLRPEEATVQVAYYRPISDVVAASTSISVITVTFPSGAVFTRAAECLIDDISPAGEPAAQRRMALRCDVNGESSLLVLAPADLSGGYAVAEGSAGSVRVELDREGVGTIAFPEGASSVTIFAADGAVVGEVPILTA